MSMSNFVPWPDLVPWPDDWPKYRNGGQLCDMKVGPCACGASHQVGEFKFDGFCGILTRYDKMVTPGDTQLKPTWGNQMKNVTVLKRRWDGVGVGHVYVPILKDESFADLKALEKCIMDESFINITNSH